MANIIKPSGINRLWASGGTKVDPGLQKTNIGWVVELPPYQYQNWVDNRQDTFIAHINQHGIPEWDVETEYQGNLSYTQGSDGIIYKCISTHVNFNPVNPLNAAYWVRAFEAFGSVAVVQNQLTTHLNNYATLSGITNPVLARSNLSVYSKTESDARFAAYNGNSTVSFGVGNAAAPSHAVPLGQLTSLLLSATESTAGQISIATLGEVEQGVNDTKAVTSFKGNAVYLKKSGNLSGLANIAVARNNLGLGSIATESSGSFLRGSNNLSDISSPAVARNNLGLGDIATRTVATFLQTSNNLLDLGSVSAARTNLGLTALATTDPNTILTKTGNLAGLADVATARSNLGLGTVATQSVDLFLTKAGNLANLGNVQAARNNLGLGSLATSSAVGALAGDLNFASLQAVNGYQYNPSGILEQWGLHNMAGRSHEQTIRFPIPFSKGCYNIQLTNIENYGNEGNTVRVTRMSTVSFSISNGGGNTYTAYLWRAIGA